MLQLTSTTKSNIKVVSPKRENPKHKILTIYKIKDPACSSATQNTNGNKKATKQQKDKKSHQKDL